MGTFKPHVGEEMDLHTSDLSFVFTRRKHVTAAWKRLHTQNHVCANEGPLKTSVQIGIPKHFFPNVKETNM